MRYVYVCMYIRLKQLTNRNIDNTDNKRKSKPNKQIVKAAW